MTDRITPNHSTERLSDQNLQAAEWFMVGLGRWLPYRATKGPLSPEESRLTGQLSQQAAQIFTELRSETVHQDELLKQSRYDTVTGLYKREVIANEIQPAIEESMNKDPNAIWAVFVIDANNFKFINDTYGHATGDLALRAIGDSIHDAVREGDYGVRTGGDEFEVYAQISSSRSDASSMRRSDDTGMNIVWRILNSMQEHPYQTETGVEKVTASAGYAIITDSSPEGIEAARQQADKNMYHAKRGQET